jgi:hypothetical protein
MVASQSLHRELRRSDVDAEAGFPARMRAARLRSWRRRRSRHPGRVPTADCLVDDSIRRWRPPLGMQRAQGERMAGAHERVAEVMERRIGQSREPRSRKP